MAIEMANTNTALSTNDKRILDALFDPETLPSSVARTKDSAFIDPSLPPHPTIPLAQLVALEAQQHDIVRDVSRSPNIDTTTRAITKLDRIISEWPAYASAHVNRAMLRRLRIEATLQGKQTIFSAPCTEIQAMFADLSRAIHLSLPPSSSPSAPVSPHQARILRTANSHRAFLYLKAVETGTQLRGLDRAEMEELASRDFAAAARYGDEVAREMSVRTNPYAKICGAIVKNALAEERKCGGC